MFETDLSPVSIGIKTFIRDPQLFNAIREVRRTMPDARLIVVDDGDPSEEKDSLYTELSQEGHTVIVLPFDSGFGKKANAMVQALKTPYILISSDDFDHSSHSVREGIEILKCFLDSNHHFHIASGRVDNRGGAYEFDLEDLGDKIIEHPVAEDSGAQFVPCDLTYNYSLIRKEVFDKVSWDDENKMGGGEHGAFFVDCKRAGFKTAYIPGVYIAEQKIPASPRYKQFRARSFNKTRVCFDKRGIREYVLGSGQVDYQK